MNYLIVSPVRSGSTWLNLTLAKHLKLYNVGEALCKISPTLILNSNQDSLNFASQLANSNTDLRKLSREELILHLIWKKPFVAKLTPWDLYESGEEEYGGLGYEFSKFKDHVKPITTIFLYRKNLLEHYISFWGVHKTGVMNTYNRFMNYNRPRIKYTQEELDAHAIGKCEVTKIELKSLVQAPCKIYARGNLIVWGKEDGEALDFD